MGDLPVQCRAIITRSWQNRERNHADQIGPAPPPPHLGQPVRPHEPDKPHMREKPFQARQRIDRIACADMALDIGCNQPARAQPPQARPHPGQPLRQRRHARRGLERIARRDQEPDLIKPELAQRPAGQLDMAFMHRVERSPQQAHAHGPPVPPDRRDCPRAAQQAQARTCPVPITS